MWGFWVFMLVMDLLVPATMIFLGRYFEKKPPKEINGVFGYRTTMSMKNRETWEFAHSYAGKLWNKCGCAILVLSVIAMLLVARKDIDTVSKIGMAVCIVQTVIMVLTIIPTERALKKTFDKNGKRRK